MEPSDKKILKRLISLIVLSVIIASFIIIGATAVMVVVSVILFLGGSLLLLMFLSKFYILYGRKRENSWICLENNQGKFVGMKIGSTNLDFQRSGNEVEKWNIIEKDGGPEPEILEGPGLTAIGKGEIPTWPVTTAKLYRIETNDHEFVHPKTDDEVGTYRLIPKTEFTMNPKLFITHTFETAPVVTINPKTGAKTSVVGLFQVQLFVFNTYRATYMTDDFMKNVNQTLQSGTRELTATFSYIAFISASSEGGEKKLSTEDKKTVRDYGTELKETVKDSLAQYGIGIKDLDFIDAYLADKRVEKAQNEIQIKIFEAEGRKIEADSLAEADKVRAVGEAAFLKERMKVVKEGNLTRQQQDLLEAEIAANAHVEGMEKFRGSVYSQGGNSSPAIVDLRKDDGSSKGGHEKGKNPKKA